jgi:hypothetical protein
MDARVKSCEHCNQPVPETKRGRPQRFCSDRCRQAHRKFAFTSEEGLRYRTGRLKRKSDSQAFDLAWELEPKNLSLKSRLRFERVNEITFKLTDGEATNVPASHGQWGGYRTTKAVSWVINIAPGQWLRDVATRRPGLLPLLRQSRMLSQWRGALMATTSSRIQSTTSTDCKLAFLTTMGSPSDGPCNHIQKLGRS